MKDYGIEIIPSTNNDYTLKWTKFKEVFKEQFVPEVAVSVMKKE